LVTVTKDDFIIVQEIMCSVVKQRKFFNSFLRDWYLYEIDFVSISRGLLSAWNPKFIASKLETFSLGIVVDLEYKILKCFLRLINVYGPFYDIFSF